jgi:dUTP pyrophosphatase
VVKIELQIQRTDKEVPLPEYAHEGDAAFDLRSIEETSIPPGDKHIIQTGLKMVIPLGYFGNIRDRSGLAAKQAAHVLAGVVDSGYRGTVGVVMINLGKEPIEIKKGDRVAQMLIQKIETPTIVETKDLDNTTRGEGGFGSTGKQ